MIIYQRFKIMRNDKMKSRQWDFKILHSYTSFITLYLLHSHQTHLTRAQSDRENGANTRLSMDEFGTALDPHPNVNEENYPGMIYVGRMHNDGTRVGFEEDNGA